MTKMMSLELSVEERFGASRESEDERSYHLQKKQQGSVKKRRSVRKLQLVWYKDLTYLGIYNFSQQQVFWLLGLVLLGKKG